MAENLLAVVAASWGVLMGLSPVLQIRRMLSERSSRDLSVGYFLILLVGFLLWICYGIVARNPVLIVPNSISFVAGAVTVFVALRLRPRRSSARLWGSSVRQRTAGYVPGWASGSSASGLGSAASRYPGIHLITSARNRPSHSSWQSTPMPAVETRCMSTYEGGMLRRRPTAADRMSVTRDASARSHSRLNLNDSTRDGSASGAR